MDGHDHDWSPVAGARAQYRCACGATGYRSGMGAIVPHKARREHRARWDVRPARWTDGQVPAAPSLDDYDRSKS